MANEIPFQDVPVEKVMTARPTVIEADASLAGAAQALLQGGFRHLPVVDDAGRPVGILSERDLRARLGTDLYGFSRATVEALAEPVSGVMTPDPISVPVGTRTAEVLDTFADERVGALLVVDEDDRVRGILSYVDLLLWLRDHAARGEVLPPRSEAGRPARKPARARAPARRARARPGARKPVRKATRAKAPRKRR
jgi:CBS domain-containing protein